MGMHHGIIAADVSLDRLVAAINEHIATLEPGDTHASLGELDLEPKDDGWPMAMGERDGKVYILDTSLVLSAGHDLIPALSADLGGATVVGTGADTTSGTFWLLAARDGEAIRSYWNCYTDMRQPWTRGEPLASGAQQPKPAVVMRDGGYDLVPGGSPWADAAKPENRGPFGLFRRG
jgi:hypothetical protein